MKTITVVSTKGGSGKTTLSVNIALAAHLRGRATHLVDVDPQGSSCAALKARQGPGPRFEASTAGKLFQIQQAALRRGVEVLVIDTPGHVEAEIADAVRIADLCIAVARPTFLDLAAAVRTFDMVRRLRRAGLVVLNQAQPPRNGIEAPAVARALRALRETGFDVSPAVIRTRAAYQLAVAQGLSVEEWDRDPARTAAREIAALWRDVDERLQPPPSPGLPHPMFIPAPPPGRGLRV